MIDKSEVEYFGPTAIRLEDITPGKIVIDKKHGCFYTVLHLANNKVKRDDIPIVVVYQGIDGAVYTMLVSAFVARFKTFIIRRNNASQTSVN